VIEDVTVVFRSCSDEPPVENPPIMREAWAWLWRVRGQLLVLSVPYRKGRHYAKSISEFAPLLMKLKALHEAGFVHGDIRCFNIVFSEEDSHFIDYDLGGKTDEKGDGPPYPCGYSFMLRDGSRLGSVGEAIRDVYDWSALVSALFECHRIRPPKGVQSDIAVTLAMFPFRTPGELCREPGTKDGTIQRLEDLLAQAENESGWEVVVGGQLRAALKLAGFGTPTSDEDANMANVSATGSQKKQ
jgi:serine/threonine protein kinase